MSLCEITPTLFLGGADAALNGAMVTRKGITLMVNATLSHPCPAYPGVQVLRVPVRDLPDARLGDHFDPVGRRIHSNRTGGTLVYCAAGRSRSPALIMAYLMKYRGVTLRQAHLWVRNSRPCVSINIGFWEQLLSYERRLYGDNTVRIEPTLPVVGTHLPSALSRYRWSDKSHQQSPVVTSRHRSPRSPVGTSRRKLTSKLLRLQFVTSLERLNKSPG
ncbi:dual specificity protein phosphatase 18 [Hippocampus zosterae]|uniref:dual specificity protein phosphatase 18 n=1 Tax=Hippocampus zosterae TaxID=109293 RepID=UPI00223D19FE|nr:dual specificity protein phosphatase 18 [Hippocampus zosterae]